jgi:hypothetical protein
MLRPTHCRICFEGPIVLGAKEPVGSALNRNKIELRYKPYQTQRDSQDTEDILPLEPNIFHVFREVGRVYNQPISKSQRLVGTSGNIEAVTRLDQ